MVYEIGEIYENKYGEKFEIISKKTIGKTCIRKVRFLFDGYECECRIESLKCGNVINKNTKPDKYSVGTKHVLKGGQIITILERVDNSKRLIEFDINGYKTIATMAEILTSNIKNPFIPIRYGVGYFGEGIYKYNDYYSAWSHMLERCYNKATNKSYNLNTVCEEWHNYQNFAKWYEENYPHHIKDIKFELDKDLLQFGIESKTYSPDTCLFLPKRINLFISRRIKYNNGYTAPFDKRRKNWIGIVSDFNTGKQISKRFKTSEEAHEFYLKVRAEQAEKAKDYLRSLNYLPEETIQLVK